MKVLYVISPDYLDAIVKETKDYSFAIQGYADVDTALESLYKTNISDILGFLYMADSMPDYYNSLLDVVNKCSLMCDMDKTFLFVVKDGKDLGDFLENIDYTAVNIKATTGYEVITDVIIKNSILTILSSQETPYLDLDLRREIVDEEEDKDPTLSYQPLFSERLLDITSDVFILDSYDETKLFDIILRKYEGFDELVYELRDAYIKAKFGMYKDISKLIDSTKGDNLIYCTLECIGKEINDTYLLNSQEV